MKITDLIPKESVDASTDNPKHLLLYGGFKLGKSSIASHISQHHTGLWLDYEDASDCHPGRKINVLARYRDLKKENPKITLIDFLEDLFSALSESQEFDFIIHDKLDNLEQFAEVWATRYYKSLAMGKNFDGSTVLQLEKGAGYMYLREKFKAIWRMIMPATKHHIFLCSIKDKYIEKGGSGANASTDDIQLTGKIREIVCGTCDAIGFMYRQKDGKNYVTFKTNDQGTFCGSRIKRLEGKKFPFSWLNSEGQLEVDLGQIYNNL